MAASQGGVIKLAAGVTRKERIAADQTGQRRRTGGSPRAKRFAPQGVDHMAVIHDVAALAVTVSPTARQGQQMGGPEVWVEPVIMQSDTWAVADQARRHGAEHPPENEPAGRGDGDMGLFGAKETMGVVRRAGSSGQVGAPKVRAAKSDRSIRPGSWIWRSMNCRPILRKTGAMQGPPMTDAAFQRPPHRLKYRVAAQNFPQNRDTSQSRCRFQHGHDLSVKYPRQVIGPPPVTWHPLEQRRPWVLTKPVIRGCAVTGFGSRDRRRVGRSINSPIR